MQYTFLSYMSDQVFTLHHGLLSLSEGKNTHSLADANWDPYQPDQLGHSLLLLQQPSSSHSETYLKQLMATAVIPIGPQQKTLCNSEL